VTRSDPTERHHTAEQDRVPFWQKVAIGTGEVPTLGRHSIEQLALPIYNITLGVSPLLVTTALSLSRLLDAFTDPLAGSLSDNTRSRWGRRKPFLFASALVCGVTLPLVWLVPGGWSETGYFAYLVAALLVFYVAYSFYNVPLFALALEATPDYHERTRVAAVKSFFTYSMGMLSTWLFAITQLKAFEGTMQGARIIGFSTGVIVAAAGLVPVLFVREGYRKLAVAKKGLPFVRSVRETFLNRSFLLLGLMATGNKMTGSFFNALGIYLFIYYVYAGNTKDGAFLAALWGTCYQATTILTIPAVTWLSTRLGKIRALRVCLGTLAVGAISSWFTYRPDRPYLVLLTAVLLGPGQTAFYAIVRSLIADICDDDELRTGLRREGMYASMAAWIDKAMASLALLLAGAILTLVGFNRGDAHQAASALFYMRVAYVAVPLTGVTLALIALRYFPLTQARCLEIRRLLEQRRGASYVQR
jgi:GPH family glycoside/pentoside/hexuronide:cation symporter